MRIETKRLRSGWNEIYRAPTGERLLARVERGRLREVIARARDGRPLRVLAWPSRPPPANIVRVKITDPAGKVLRLLAYERGSRTQRPR